MLIIQLLILAVSIAVLVKSSDLFVDGAERVGISFGLPSFLVGVVIVGVGTSLPELVSSIVAVINNESGIVAGNVVGSNITNIFLVLGVAALMTKEFKFSSDILHGDLPILLSSSLLLFFALRDGTFSRGEAAFFILGLVVYLIHSVFSHNKDDEDERVKAKWTDWLKLLISPVLIYLGAKYTIEAVIEISTLVKIGTEIIALSAVALGTSLPEVMVSISAAKRGNSDMVVGNIIGSNIFNTFAVMGIPGLITNLQIPADLLTFSLPLSVAATLLYVIMTVDKKIPRSEGGFLLIFYVYFIGRLYNLF